MNDEVVLEYNVTKEDFTRAGEASSDVKKYLKQIGVSPEAVRKVADCVIRLCYYTYFISSIF